MFNMQRHLDQILNDWAHTPPEGRARLILEWAYWRDRQRQESTGDPGGSAEPLAPPRHDGPGKV